MLNKTQRINLIAGYILLSFFFTYYILGYENLILNNLFFTNKYDLLSDQLALKFFLTPLNIPLFLCIIILNFPCIKIFAFMIFDLKT